MIQKIYPNRLTEAQLLDFSRKLGKISVIWRKGWEEERIQADKVVNETLMYRRLLKDAMHTLDAVIDPDLPVGKHQGMAARTLAAIKQELMR